MTITSAKVFTIQILLFCLLGVQSLIAQTNPAPSFNDPFTKQGFGELLYDYNTTQFGMGGLGAAYSHSHIASSSNPASLGALEFTSFQVGVNLNKKWLSSNGASNQSLYGNLNNLSLAFPLQNSITRVLDGKTNKLRVGMAISLKPYSESSYNVTVTGLNNSGDSILNSFRGSGNNYKLQWGTGFKYDDFRAGVNASLIFGRSSDETFVYPYSISQSNRITVTSKQNLNAFELDLGAQYDLVLEKTELKKVKYFTFGATTTLGSKFNFKSNSLVTSRNTFSILDTLKIQDAEKQSLDIPAGFSVGVMYNVANKLSVGLDYSTKLWSNINQGTLSGLRLKGFKNSQRIALGTEWTPSYQAYGNFLKRIKYRAGGYYATDYRPIVDNEMGVSFGLGLPVVLPRQEISFVNVSLNVGQFTSPSDIKQSFMRLNVGFTLTDNSWFYKRRFK